MTKYTCKDCIHFASPNEVCIHKPKQNEIMYCKRHRRIFDDLGDKELDELPYWCFVKK